jgi:Flp pilus assembly protein TadD
MTAQAKPAATSPAAPTPPPATSVPLAKAKAPAVMSIEEDLPTLLARLRREKTQPALSQPVAVARVGGRRDLLDEDGNTAIKVGVAPQAGQDAAHAAYDALMLGHYEEALTNYDHALATEPRSPALLLGRATALQKLGRVADARMAYNKVLAIDPKNREALTNATALVAAQAPERALTDLRALRQANPGFSPIDAEIAAQEAARGNIPGAIEAMGEAVSISPDNGLYRLNLAILQDRAEMNTEAVASYRAALDLLGSGNAALPVPIEQIKRRLAYLEGR